MAEAKQYYVYSTLTADNKYNLFAKGGADVPTIEKSATIKGGANVANDKIMTPRGVVTTVSSDDLEMLKKNPVFKQHCDNGFIHFEVTKMDAEVAADNMSPKDNSAPIVPQDFSGNEMATPV